MDRKSRAKKLSVVKENTKPASLSMIITPWLFQGPARSDDEVFTYIEEHFDWSTLASDKELIAEAKMARIYDALQGKITIEVKDETGATKKKRVRKFVKPTEFDADGNSEPRWKPTTHCTEKQLREVNSSYSKMTTELGEATNTFAIHAITVLRQRSIAESSRPRALTGITSRKKSKLVQSPANQYYFMELVEVISVNPDTGDRTLQVKVPEQKPE